jgi:hypothetical protein
LKIVTLRSDDGDNDDDKKRTTALEESAGAESRPQLLGKGPRKFAFGFMCVKA